MSDISSSFKVGALMAPVFNLVPGCLSPCQPMVMRDSGDQGRDCDEISRRVMEHG
ncbi:hypothetical protein [Halomonas organivorans]|uniref:Uncharacterized protein n=1 Tax=Halomonas organivorans TaxID=257772 RepID=A0A7W5G4B5_9GAMM|nr:hypothetical protein [Halomonas organivorans]MBB3139760.1 hypothetical protein [Halomonas organivorans]